MSPSSSVLLRRKGDTSMANNRLAVTRLEIRESTGALVPAIRPSACGWRCSALPRNPTTRPPASCLWGWAATTSSCAVLIPLSTPTWGHASAAMTLDVYSGLFDDNLDGLSKDEVGSADPMASVSEIRSATTESALVGQVGLEPTTDGL